MKQNILNINIRNINSKVNSLLIDSKQKKLAKDRIHLILSLTKNGIPHRRKENLYFALLCNSIVETVSKRIINEAQLYDQKEDLETKRIPELLSTLNIHGYITQETYIHCNSVNNYRRTIHLNPGIQYETIKSRNSILFMCSFVEEIFQKYEIIKEKPQTIINIIGGCELKNYSDLAILSKYGINNNFLNNHYSQFINNDKLVLITDYNVDKKIFHFYIKALLKEILLHEVGNIYSIIFMTGTILASKEFGIDETTVSNWINDCKFKYNHIRNVHKVFYKKYPRSFYLLINNEVNNRPQLIRTDPRTAIDFAFFLTSYTHNKNLSNVTLLLLKLYELSNDYQIFQIITDIYWPPSPQTNATTKKRISVIKKLFNDPQTNKTILYQFIVEMLPHKKSSCSGYFDINGKLYDINVTANELKTQYQEFQELAIEYSNEPGFQFVLAQNINYLDYTYLRKFIDNYTKDARYDDDARKVYLAIFVFAFDSNTPPFIRNELSQILDKKNQYLKLDNLELFKYIFNIDNVNKQVVVKFFNGLDQEHIFAVLTSYLDSSEIECDFGAVLSDYKTQLTDNDISDIMDCVLSNNEKGEKLISSYLNFSYDNLTETIIQKISKYSEEDRIKFLCIAPITDFTLPELNKLSPDSQQYFWKNRSDFLNRFNCLSPKNQTYVLNSLIQYSRPYALLAIFNMFSYMPIDNELFLKAIELLPSSKEFISSPYYEDSLLGFAIDHIKNSPKSDKYDKALKYMEERSNYLFKEKCRLCEQGKNDSQKSQLMG